MITPAIFSGGFAVLAVQSHGFSSFVFAIMALLSALDVRGRYKDYVFCQRQLEDSDTDEEIVNTLIQKFRYAHCERQALMMAVRSAGSTYQEEYAEKQFRELGYRWYHLLPDWFTKKPTLLFSLRFWRAFLGLR